MTRTPQAHPEVTLRTRSKPVPDSGSATSELSRYTTVTCLVCGVPAYRVAQRITPDLASEEGPLLPTEDWVEKELCKSSSGWIEAFQGCLVSLVPCDPHSPGVCGASATSPMRRYASPSALAPLSASHDAIDVCVCVCRRRTKSPRPNRPPCTRNSSASYSLAERHRLQRPRTTKYPTG